MMNKEIVNEFKSSWQEVFDSRECISKYLPEYRIFLEMLMGRGWNEKCRAGTSLYDLLLSR